MWRLNATCDVCKLTSCSRQEMSSNQEWCWIRQLKQTAGQSSYFELLFFSFFWAFPISLHDEIKFSFETGLAEAHPCALSKCLVTSSLFIDPAIYEVHRHWDSPSHGNVVDKCAQQMCESILKGERALSFSLMISVLTWGCKFRAPCISSGRAWQFPSTPKEKPS